MDKSKVVNYEGRKFAVGLNWKEVTGSKPNILKNKIKELVSRNKYDGFGAKIEIDKTKIQVGFSNKKAKDVPSLAKIFSEQEMYRGSLVLAKIEEEQYWALSLTEEGLIVSGYDTLYNQDKFVETISEFLEFEDENVAVFIAENDSSEIKALLGDSLEDIDDIKTFDIDDIIASMSKGCEVSQVYNPSLDTIKQLSVLAITVSALVGSYFYVYKENPLYEEISTGLVGEEFDLQYRKYQDKLKKSKKTKVDADSYINFAKTEILSLRNATYSNKEIIGNIDELFNNFPLYLVEWELNDIRYSGEGDNLEYFSVTYKRIQSSFGYKEELERNLKEILKKHNYDRYFFSYPNNKGDAVEVKIFFKDKKVLELGNENINNDELTKRTNEINQSLKNIKKEISSLQDEVADFGFYDKRYGSKLEEQEESIYIEVDKGKKLFKEIKDQKSNFEKQEIAFDTDLIKGNRNQMLSMMQQYSYYNWKEASKPIMYPSNQGRSKDIQATSFAQSYEFAVSVGSNIDVIGLSGLRTMLLNDNLLNKKHVKIKEISFILNNEVWSVKGETYEKL